ncbi:MAG: pilus assembly protein PilM [Verrucomicrobiales bacterium]|nr:pilus assembly protein PilM [Verrucomicrobiales bacterium]
MADDRIISLTLGSQQITGAIFSRGANGSVKLEKLEHRDFIGDPAEDSSRNAQGAQALNEIVAALKIKGKKVSYVVTSFPVLLKFASLPALDGAQVDQIVEFEAQQQVPYPINEVVWGYQLMGDPDDIEVEVLLAAVKSDELNEIDEMVTASGVKSAGAEVSPVAMYNALAYNYSDYEGAVLLVDIGARTTDMIFREGGKSFIRTVKIGGADISRAIAKEFGTEFGAADQRKINDGFVALGGAYADHEDPEIAGISKVVRNSLTRLHSEIMRTITFYRSQQGGGAPEMLLLSGATSGLPFIREFFAEKLNLPVDHFNPFRNVSVAKGVDSGFVSTNAHRLGDLVGSALQQAGDVPMAIDLIPESVQNERILAKRKPALIVSVLALSAFLAAMGVFFNKGAEVTSAKAAEIESKAGDLKAHNDAILDAKDEIDRIDGQMNPYKDAVIHRIYWVRVFNYLASKMENDLLYLTTIEPLSAGVPLIADQDSQLSVAGTEETATVDSFLIKGLWRENANGNNVVYDYFKRLKDDASDETTDTFFDLEDADVSEVLKADAGTSDDRYAYPFEMKLPLPEGNQVKFSK